MLKIKTRKVSHTKENNIEEKHLHKVCLVSVFTLILGVQTTFIFHLLYFYAGRYIFLQIVAFGKSYGINDPIIFESCYENAIIRQKYISMNSHKLIQTFRIIISKVCHKSFSIDNSRNFAIFHCIKLFMIIVLP